MDDNDSIILDISRKSTSNKYFCSHCNTRLTPLTQEDMKGGYHCSRCTITFWPQQTPVKQASKFDLPGPDTNDHGDIIGDKTIPMVTIYDPNKELSSTSYNSQKLPPSFEALQKAGYLWVSYEER
jgi:hypothetical protein